MNKSAIGKVDGRLTKGETEQRILDGTIELLDNGASLAGLSVNRIVEASGVSRATFYLHFADKRELVSRLAETELIAFQQVSESFVADPDAGRDELAEAITELAKLWSSHAGVLSSLIEMAEYDSDTRDAWHSLAQSVAATVAPAIRARRPELDEAMVITLSDVIVWTCERTLHQMVGRDATAAQTKRAADGLTEAIWRIVAPASSFAQ